jgi:hypothetical protein
MARFPDLSRPLAALQRAFQRGHCLFDPGFPVCVHRLLLRFWRVLPAPLFCAGMKHAEPVPDTGKHASFSR